MGDHFKIASKEAVETYLKTTLAKCDNEIKKFKDRFDHERYIDAFEWADGTIEAVQMQRLCRLAADIVQEQGTETLYDYLRDEVMLRAKWNESSTSTCANLNSRAHIKAHAEMYDDLTRWYGMRGA